MSSGKEPAKILLRARDIHDWLGISLVEFYKYVRAGLIPRKRIAPNGRYFYKKEDIKRIFLEGFK